MPDRDRFLLGFGERLTAQIAPPGGGASPKFPYTYADAVERLFPRIEHATNVLSELPRLARPDGNAVGVVTLHPQAVAKSYSPQVALAAYGLRQVGSRPVTVIPDAWTREGEPTATLSTDLFVAGQVESFRRFAHDVGTGAAENLPGVSEAVRRLEDWRAPLTEDRLRVPQDSVGPIEIVLHARESDSFIVEAFREFAAQLGIETDLDRRLFAGGLCFLPVHVSDPQSLESLAEFAFLRVARPVPRLRGISPIERSHSLSAPACALPAEGPVDADLRVAVFDGGFPKPSPLAPWVDTHEADSLAAPVEYFTDHGHDVTSAVLFGSLAPGGPAPRPYAFVDHYRVLDENAKSDPLELYDTLRRIQDVLKDRSHEFFNLSVGPSVPVEDDEVHTWTAVLDEHLSDGHALATIAVGNAGDKLDPAERRVQIPSDAVNGFAVGAADSQRMGWARADYSSSGPGRSPGVVKPDVLGFGGCDQEPFLVFDKAATPGLAWTKGTSFAAPLAMRQALGIRAHFGDRISPLAIRALLVHAAENGAGHNRAEVGWGRIPGVLDDFVLCPDGVVRVVYQGELTPSKYLRALVPVPPGNLKGLVEIRATLAYATPIDPEDPGNYTRSGLDITFRPHRDRFAKNDAVNPRSRSFFKSGDFDPEHTLRRDAQKWETVLHQSQRFRGGSLKAPVFDIHYNARAGGAATRGARPVRYALVVDVISPHTPDLYDMVVRTFAGRLEVLRPVIEIPVQTQI